MLKSIKSSVAGALVVTSLVLTQTGCKKTEDTIAKVIVKDADTQAIVADAQVVLFGQSTENKQSKVNVSDTTTTNAAGEAIINYSEKFKNGQAGVFVLNIEATKGNKTGTGVIKVNEEETTIETVFIQE